MASGRVHPAMQTRTNFVTAPSSAESTPARARYSSGKTVHSMSMDGHERSLWKEKAQPKSSGQFSPPPLGRSRSVTVLEQAEESTNWSKVSKKSLLRKPGVHFLSRSDLERKRYKVSVLLSGFAMLGMLLAVGANELSEGFLSTETVNLVLACVSATTFISVAILYYYYLAEDLLGVLASHLENNTPLRSASLIRSGLTGQFFVECVVLCLHIPPGIDVDVGFTFQYFGQEVKLEYSLISLGAIATTLRLYLPLRSLVNRTLLQYNNKTVIAKQTSVQINSRFAIKQIMDQHAIPAIAIFTLLFLIVASYWMQVLERPYNEDLQKYLDALWLVWITMTTVGYGDSFPVTSLGRAITVTASSTGIAIAALLTAALSSWLAWSPLEFKARTLMEKEAWEMRYAHAAAKVIQRRWRRSLKSSCCGTSSNKHSETASAWKSVKNLYNEWKQGQFNLQTSLAELQEGSSEMLRHVGHIALDMGIEIKNSSIMDDLRQLQEENKLPPSPTRQMLVASLSQNSAAKGNSNMKTNNLVIDQLQTVSQQVEQAVAAVRRVELGLRLNQSSEEMEGVSSSARTEFNVGTGSAASFQTAALQQSMLEQSHVSATVMGNVQSMMMSMAQHIEELTLSQRSMVQQLASLQQDRANCFIQGSPIVDQAAISRFAPQQSHPIADNGTQYMSGSPSTSGKYPLPSQTSQELPLQSRIDGPDSQMEGKIRPASAHPLSRGPDIGQPDSNIARAAASAIQGLQDKADGRKPASPRQRPASAMPSSHSYASRSAKQSYDYIKPGNKPSGTAGGTPRLAKSALLERYLMQSDGVRR